MQQYFENIINGIEKTIREDPAAASPRKKFALEISKLGRDLYAGRRPVAWCGIVAPFEILNAMDITSCFVEFIGAMLSSTGAVATFLEGAEQSGFGTDGCSYHRSVLGAAEKGIMPKPEVLIGTTCPCTGGIAVIENLAKIFNKETFILHIPQDESSENVRFLAGLIKDMVEFVELRTGIKLNRNRFLEAIENSNRMRNILGEVYEMARKVPSPFNGKELNNFGIVMSLFLGTKRGIEIAETYRREFSRRIESGHCGVPGEKIRLMWIQNRVQFKNSIVQMLEKEYNAAIVIDELNSITWQPIDPDDPYTGIARRSLSIPFNGPVTRRIDHLKKLCELYKVDGAINPNNWGCRQGAGSRGLIEEGLKEIGVPVLNLEVDCIDSRNFAEGQIRTRLEAFMEMLENKRS